MDAVGKLGSYISRSVYIVSGPFHPFGGAVDIIVVEQPDGSFKSSPWYVRFGKFQGVLKAKEKVVSVIVNGVEADFHMYLDHKGEAHFIREVDVKEEDSSISPLSSGEDTDGQSSSRRPMKSKSCNYDAYQSNTVTQIDVSDGRILSRSNSRRSRILGFVLGRRSAKDNRFLGENDSGSPRKESMESAEIAADLLEVKWSRSMVSSRRKKDGVAQLTTQDISESNSMKDLITGVQNNEDSVKHDTVVDNLVNNSPLQHVGSFNDEKDHSSCSVPIESMESMKETGMTISCSVSMYVAGTSPIEGNNNSISQMLSENEKLCVSDGGGSMNSMDAKIEACSGEQLVLGDLQKTDITLQDKHQPESCSNLLNPSFGKDYEKNLECDGVPLNQVDNGYMTKIFSEGVSIQSLHGSVEGMESQIFSTISTLNSPNCQPLLEKTTIENGKMVESVSPLDTIDYPVGSCLRRSESPEELFFGELDDMKGFDGVQREETISQRHEGECELLVSQIISEENNGSALANNFSKLSGECSGSQDLAGSALDRGIKLKIVSSDLNIHDKDGSQVEEVFRIARSLPNMPTHDPDLSNCGVTHSLERTPDPYSATLEHTRVHESILGDKKSEADNDHQPSKSQQLNRDVRSIENLENGSEYLNVGTSSEPLGTSPKSWKSWSFTSNRSRSMKLSEGALGDSRSSIVQNVSKGENGVDDEKGVPKLKATKKQIRTTTPTTEELKSLKLKEGLNTVAFTFSTPMLGKQQVEARIHLWKWDSRIVISDVDGTITRSDLLGQVMPWVGVDWSQTGVAHLFSAIKENGYHVLFLSARAISQAYHTRQFLENLKQDGKALPEGPVVISPDGLFPSLYREVVRRAPHEFKISCLEAIKALFPPDRNPFYAGFGNRDTDEISYLKVGIPKGKIFIINPKGEIVVNRRVDRNSYTSLHAIVDDMFPLMSSSEQEDFNSWNYWKLPLPSDI